MSIIGTRPPLISETNLYELHHRARLAIKPGITGMWQVSGRSDITDFEGEFKRVDAELQKRKIMMVYKPHFHELKGDTAGYNSVLSSRSTIGEGCYLEVSYVHRNSKIGDHCVLSYIEVSDREIPDNVVLHGLKQRDGSFCKAVGLSLGAQQEGRCRKQQYADRTDFQQH